MVTDLMETIQIKVPKTISSGILSWNFENWLNSLWQYKLDQDDVELVENEKSKIQNGISLDYYLISRGVN